jgi:hypothetical protein
MLKGELAGMSEEVRRHLIDRALQLQTAAGLTLLGPLCVLEFSQALKFCKRASAAASSYDPEIELAQFDQLADAVRRRRRTLTFSTNS